MRVMRGVAAATALALAACNTPTPSLRLALAGGPAQACPSTNCAMVMMKCATVMSIRIFDPQHPNSPFLSECVMVPLDRGNDMCALASVDLESTPIPVEGLEVDVALYPMTQIHSDSTGDLMCPGQVEYSAVTGFPVEQAPNPALGGRAFYHPGDQAVTVTLGCTDLDAINTSCVVASDLTVTATVDDLDTQLPVPGGAGSVAENLLIQVGEPHAQGSQFVLNSTDTRMLNQANPAGDNEVATWTADIDLQLRSYVCLEVTDQSSTTQVPPSILRCTQATSDRLISLRGMLISYAKVMQIFSALPPQISAGGHLPAQGLTIGVVANAALSPVGGRAVTAGSGTISYWTGTGLSSNPSSSSGIFVSTDAPFGTTFTAQSSDGSVTNGVGGLVAGKITVVVLTVDDV